MWKESAATAEASTRSSSLLSEMKNGYSRMLLVNNYDDNSSAGSSSSSSICDDVPYYYWNEERQQHQVAEVCSSSLLYKVLHWMKLIVLKVARTYYAMPIILILIPLVVGLLIGFMMGRQYERKGKNKSRFSWLNRIKVYAMRWMMYFAMYNSDCSTFSKVKESSSSESALSSSSNKLKSPSSSSTTTTITATKEQELDEDKEDVIKLDLNGWDVNQARVDLRKIDKQTQPKQQQAKIQEIQQNCHHIPKHIAVIMDGNRRYGKAKYGTSSGMEYYKGHWDGCKKLLEFAKWCIVEKVEIVTVFAFSTENWNRKQSEIDSIMNFISTYIDELRSEAKQLNIRINILSTQYEKIPAHLQKGIERLMEDTKDCEGTLELNICLSYSGRDEIVHACQQLVNDAILQQETVRNNNDNDKGSVQIEEEDVRQKLLTHRIPDPDILIRTSGEIRISNFLLWQLAYTEMFFVDKNWPEMEKEDLDQILNTYGSSRHRRFGK